MTPKELPALSPAEWKVMKVVWEKKRCAARDVYTVTRKRYGWAVGTTKNLLHRLVEKGHLKTEQIGNSYLYEAASSPLKSLCTAADALLANTVEGTTGPLFLHMVKKGKLSQKDISELRALLDQLEEETDQ